MCNLEAGGPKAAPYFSIKCCCKFGTLGHFSFLFPLVCGGLLSSPKLKPSFRSISSLQPPFFAVHVLIGQGERGSSDAEPAGLYVAAQTHAERDGALAHLCIPFKAHEGIWRVCFFPPLFLFFSFFFGNWLHKKASCEPSSLNEKHVAGIQNSGVFQRGPGRHLFLVCTAKSWSRGEGPRWKGRAEARGRVGFHGCWRGCK